MMLAARCIAMLSLSLGSFPGKSESPLAACQALGSPPRLELYADPIENLMAAWPVEMSSLGRDLLPVTDLEGLAALMKYMMLLLAGWQIAVRLRRLTVATLPVATGRLLPSPLPASFLQLRKHHNLGHRRQCNVVHFAVTPMLSQVVVLSQRLE